MDWECGAAAPSATERDRVSGQMARDGLRKGNGADEQNLEELRRALKVRSSSREIWGENPIIDLLWFDPDMRCRSLTFVACSHQQRQIIDILECIICMKSFGFSFLSSSERQMREKSVSFCSDCFDTNVFGPAPASSLVLFYRPLSFSARACARLSCVGEEERGVESSYLLALTKECWHAVNTFFCACICVLTCMIICVRVRVYVRAYSMHMFLCRRGRQRVFLRSMTKKTAT